MGFWILDLRFWIAKKQTRKHQVGLPPRQKGDNPKNCRHRAAYDQASNNREIELEGFAPNGNIARKPTEAPERKSRSGHHDQPQYHKDNANGDQKPSRLQMD
jgi:hypothetical protein